MGVAMTTGRWWGVAAWVMAAGFVQPAAAADTDVAMVIGVERFRWEEFGGRGETLLKESGPLLRIGVNYDNLRRLPRGAIYEVNGRFYFGSVDYDGQACNILTSVCTPSRSDTNYYGLRVEGAGGYRFGSRRTGIDVFGGGGFEFWSRDIEATATASGALEEYFSVLLKAGVAFSQDFGPVHLRLQAGVTYPAYTLEVLDDDFLLDIETLNPRGRATGFAKLHVQFGQANRQRMGLALYYDGLHFSESRHKVFESVVGDVEVWQPDSRRRVVGGEFSWYFL